MRDRPTEPVLFVAANANPTRRIRRQPAHPQTDRGSLRLDEDDRRPGEDQVPKMRPPHLGLHLRGCRLQSRAVAQAHRRADMSAPANCKLVGRWRIVQADIWERDHLDLCRPAMMRITGHGRGEIAFGALQAGADIEYSGSVANTIAEDGRPGINWIRSFMRRYRKERL